MNETQFKTRTKEIALRILRVVEILPKTTTASVIGKQLLRSGTSVGANYRAACRAKSTADLISKLSIVEEEADESLYWMELLIAAEVLSESKLRNLISDLDEVVAMTVSSIKTLRAKQKSKI